MVSWIEKCVVLGEIHCYTSLLLDNSKFHIHYFILFGTRKVMVTTQFFFPCIYLSSLNSLIMYFRNFISFLFLFIYEDKSILIFGNSNSKDL